MAYSDEISLLPKVKKVLKISASYVLWLMSYYKVYSAGAKIDDVIIQILRSLISLGLNFRDMTQMQK